DLKKKMKEPNENASKESIIELNNTFIDVETRLEELQDELPLEKFRKVEKFMNEINAANTYSTETRAEMLNFINSNTIDPTHREVLTSITNTIDETPAQLNSMKSEMVHAIDEKNITRIDELILAQKNLTHALETFRNVDNFMIEINAVNDRSV